MLLDRAFVVVKGRFFCDERSDDGLAFIEWEELLYDVGGVGTKGGGLDEKVEDGWDDLSKDDGVVDMDGWQVTMGENEGDMETSYVGVIVGGDAAVVWKRDATVNRLVFMMQGQTSNASEQTY